MSKIIDISKEREKNKKKKVIMNFLFTIIAIYIVYAIYLIIRTPTDTVVVDTGTLTLEESSVGYIIRDETVVQGNNYKNGVYQIVLEGERAAKNQTIFRYYGKSEEELQNKIKDIDLKLQEALEKENLSFPSDVKNLESQIDGKIQSLKNTTDIQNISEQKKQIAAIILKKATIAGENSKSGSYIKKLINQRDEYEKKLVKESEYVSAPKSGVISYRVDGFENVLTTKDFSKLDLNEIENLDIKTGRIIPTSTEKAKVMENFGCYILSVLDSDYAIEVKEGQSAQITLASGQEIPVTVEYVKKQDNDKNLIIFKLNTLTEELILYRKISFNVTWWKVPGVKVPNDAIIEEDGMKYVVKKTSNGTKKCLVKVLKSNEKYSIIGKYTDEDFQTLGIDGDLYDGIDVYDTIMMYPKQ